MIPKSTDLSQNWDETLKVAESAAVPAESLMESPEACENNEDKRMHILSPEESLEMNFSCFESRLLDPNINPDQVKRVSC